MKTPSSPKLYIDESVHLDHKYVPSRNEGPYPARGTMKPVSITSDNLTRASKKAWRQLHEQESESRELLVSPRDLTIRGGKQPNYVLSALDHSRARSSRYTRAEHEIASILGKTHRNTVDTIRRNGDIDGKQAGVKRRKRRSWQRCL